MPYCTYCGTNLSPQAVNCPFCGHPQYKPKNGLTLFFFCLFFGGLGIHRFYAGRVFSGLIMLFTFGGFGIWPFVDIVSILSGDFTDINGNIIKVDNKALALFFLMLIIILCIIIAIFTLIYEHILDQTEKEHIITFFNAIWFLITNIEYIVL